MSILYPPFRYFTSYSAPLVRHFGAIILSRRVFWSQDWRKTCVPFHLVFILLTVLIRPFLTPSEYMPFLVKSPHHQGIYDHGCVMIISVVFILLLTAN